ncbi:MAG: N-acetylmuramoyl-L-alanine amidase [Thermoplasmata archaeon]|nr:N-acetylmuramoyl-L-alanine amidase [Thermoplasmata archaeon]
MRERVRIIGAMIIFMCMIVPSIGMAASNDDDGASRAPIPETPGALTGYKICVDPGHGGSAPGTEGIDGPGYPDEKDHTLDIGLRLQTLLEAVGATVIMTRTTDADVSLLERCNIANNNNTDIFISIHCNAVGTESVMGTETFYWGNDAITYSVNGKRLAEDVQREEVAILGSNDRGAKMDFPYFGYHLYVLANTAMPAILTEVGFMSNQTEFDLLNTASYRQDAAQGILNGVMDYYGLDIHIFDIDMWMQSDGLFGLSMLNTQVDVDDTYTFCAEVNYTTGGVDEFFDGTDNVRVELSAWFDEGATPSNAPVADDIHRTRMFNAIWSEGGVPGDSAVMIYPIGSPGTNEFIMDSWWLDSSAPGDHYYIFMNITLGPQAWAADGDGFVNGAAADINDRNQALNDPHSWDFNIRIYDADFPAIENNTYEEFGVFPYLEVNAAGDPLASAPPGVASLMMLPNSQISVSSNWDYYLNVSITDLQRVGGGVSILATNVQVASMSQLADYDNSGIVVPTFFPGAGIELEIWGNTSQAVQDWMVPAPCNGTVAEGPWGSDFNGHELTELAWWVSIPGGTTEGAYEATITYTLGTYGGTVITNSDTKLRFVTGFPHTFDIDMWEQSDPTNTSVLNTVVPAGNTYTFRAEMNYSIGGVDLFNDGMDSVRVNLTAWYDEGSLGGASSPTPGDRTKQFCVEWHEGIMQGMDMAALTYPVGAPNEFSLDSWWLDQFIFDHYYLYLNVTISSLAQLADGDGFIWGPALDIHDSWQALNDMNSWDFSMTVYDNDFVAAANTSYEEFGVDDNDYIISLSEGWNLISLPLIQSDESLNSVLQSIDGKWDMILAYDGNDTDHWKTNITIRPDSLNDLSSIDHRIGFWINITQENVNLTVSGIEAESTEIPLYAGWNLVGYPTLNNSVTVSDAFWGTGVTIVEVCNTSAPYDLMEVDPSYIMQPGEGCWVYLASYTIWIVDW